MPLDDFGTTTGIGQDPAALERIYTDTRDAAYQIIERKGATYYAVAAGLVRIVQAILRDQHTVLSVSSLIHDYYGIDDVYLSLPAVIGRRGSSGRTPLGLSAEEASGGDPRSCCARRSTSSTWMRPDHDAAADARGRDRVRRRLVRVTAAERSDSSRGPTSPSGTSTWSTSRLAQRLIDDAGYRAIPVIVTPAGRCSSSPRTAGSPPPWGSPPRPRGPPDSPPQGPSAGGTA